MVSSEKTTLKSGGGKTLKFSLSSLLIRIVKILELVDFRITKSELGAFFRKEDQDYLLPFTKSRAKNPDKMKDANYQEAPETGCPVLEGAAAYIELTVKDIVDIGADHDLLVGEPVNAAILKEGKAEDTLTLPDIGWSYAG